MSRGGRQSASTTFPATIEKMVTGPSASCFTVTLSIPWLRDGRPDSPYLVLSEFFGEDVIVTVVPAQAEDTPE